jgi:hypothetical protein
MVQYTRVILLCALLVITASWADETESRAKSSPAVGESCIEIDSADGWIGRLGCLNAELRRLAETKRAGVAQLYDPAGGLGRTAPAQIGLFDQFAVAERLGGNFGHSALPQRPPAPVYALPFGPTAK